MTAGAAAAVLAAAGCASTGPVTTAASGGPAGVSVSSPGAVSGPVVATTAPSAATASSTATATATTATATAASTATTTAGAPATPTTPATASASATGTPTTPSVPAAVSAAPRSAGCPATGGGVPAGAKRRTTIDVDGDGRADLLWMRLQADGSVLIGVTTASGATFDTVYRSASPIARSVLVARPTPTSQPVLLVSDGRSIDLETVVACGIHQVTDTRGARYTFDVGFTGYGTGIGCLGPGDRPGLTGLNAPYPADRRHYTVTRTFVVLTGTTARNGARDVLHATLPRDRRLIDSARAVTCGDLTLLHDGLSVTA